MAGLDCAELSEGAWPTLRAGVLGAVAVTDDEARSAMDELWEHGLRIGESGAAPLAALYVLAADPACGALREAAGFGRTSRVLLVATEGRTGTS
jgi:diaminopropionate ammonia-lyase